jgi:hypothetical protein
MPRVGFELTIPVLERATAVLDPAVTAMGNLLTNFNYLLFIECLPSAGVLC